MHALSFPKTPLIAGTDLDETNRVLRAAREEKARLKSQRAEQRRRGSVEAVVENQNGHNIESQNSGRLSQMASFVRSFSTDNVEENIIKKCFGYLARCEKKTVLQP